MAYYTIDYVNTIKSKQIKNIQFQIRSINNVCNFYKYRNFYNIHHHFFKSYYGWLAHCKISANTPVAVTSPPAPAPWITNGRV